MTHVQLIRALRGAAVPTLCTALAAFVLAAPSAFAASSSDGRAPLVLDTQSGISDGHSGTVLQTAPLSHERIVQAKQIATPTELTPNNSSTPIIVEPYVQAPGGNYGGTSTSHTKPQPRTTQSTQ